MPLIGVLVEFSRIFRRVLPAASFNPSVMSFMPNRKRPTPPRRVPRIARFTPELHG
jgi:hypothetical protein